MQTFQWPSIEEIRIQALGTFKRFWPVLIVCFATGALSYWQYFAEPYARPAWLAEVLMAAHLLIPLLVAAMLWAERGRGPARLGLALLGAAAIPVIFALTNNHELTSSNFRFAQLLLFAHLVVGFLPFFGRREVQGFWHYNKSLFLRFLLSSLYAGVLCAGLSLSSWALTALFDLPIKEDFYQFVWIFCTFVFQPWHFLAGVPENLERLEQDESYNRALQVFVQYLLLPLLGLYGIILVAYAAKIAVTLTWPRGTVTWMVSAYACAGLFTMLLLSPLLNRPQAIWLRRASKAIYASLILLGILMLAAVARRLSDYQITEARYFALGFATWFTVVAAYLLFAKRAYLPLVPTSLAALALATVAGPWGAYSVAEQSQIRMLHSLLAEHKLVGENVKPKSVPESASQQMSSIIYYLGSHHGASAFESFFDPEKLPKSLHRSEVPLAAAKLLHVPYDRSGVTTTLNEDQSFYLRKANDGQTSTVLDQKFDLVVHFSLPTKGVDYSTVRIANLEKEGLIEIRMIEKVLAKISHKDLVKAYRARIGTSESIPAGDLIWKVDEPQFKALVLFNNISGTFNNDKNTLRITNINGVMLYTKPQP